MKAGLMRAVVGVAAVCGVAVATVPAHAANDLATCVTAEEATAFSLRHLQSRLMVAALACNQRDAYNNFVEAHRTSLSDGGEDLISYFRRTGGGQPALNRHVTELANVAGLHRAEAPEAFCQETWNMFLLLQDQPEELVATAVEHMLEDAGYPKLCVAPAPPAIQAPLPVIPAPLTAEAGGVVKAAAPAYTID